MTYDYLIFDKVFKAIDWGEKTSLTNSAGTIRCIYGIKRKNPYSMPNTKVNLIWYIVLYTKLKAIAILNKTVDYLHELEVGKDMIKYKKQKQK